MSGKNPFYSSKSRHPLDIYCYSSSGFS